jgi:hypothetical protein
VFAVWGGDARRVSISSSAKYFSQSNLSYLFIYLQTNSLKTETGTANSKPPGPIIMMGQ